MHAHSVRLGIVYLACAIVLQGNVCASGTDQKHVLPAVHSPIALDGDYTQYVYAVETDHKHLIRKELTGGGHWQRYDIDTTFGEITGLTSQPGVLYVVDRQAATVAKIQLAHHTVVPVFVGDPLLQPSDISSSSSELYLLDGRKVFRLDTAGLSATTVDAANFIPATSHLGSSKSQIVLSDSSQGMLLSVTDADSPDRVQVRTLMCPPPNCADVTKGIKPETKPEDVVPSTDTTAIISKPGPVAIRQGIIYVIDEAKHQIFASSRHMLRPVQVYSRRPELYEPGNLAIAVENLVVLDDKSHDIVVWPLLVPVQVVVDVQTSESMSAIYRYLHKTGVLPTKSVALDSSIEKTLRENRVLMGPYVESLDSLICQLNPQLCSKGTPKRALSPSTRLTVPDVYSESYIEARTVTLDGSHTLGYEVARSVKSETLKQWKTEEKLSQMNPQFRNVGILAQRKGTFTIPVETVRYVLAMPVQDLRKEHSELAQIKKRYQGVIIISSLEEAEAKPQRQQLDLPQDQRSFENAYKTLLKTIDYWHPISPDIEPYVGVAESLPDLDCHNPDLDDVVCSYQSTTVASAAQASTRTASTASQYRAYAQSDHANAVVSIIAARHTDFNGKGLAPETFVVPISNTDPPIADDIRQATLAGTRIFNLSLSFDEGVLPPNLGKYLNKDSRDFLRNVLFVVAATDDGKEVCGSVPRYPICWGDQSNVIVVAGTLIDGKTLIPNAAGSKWGPKYVHIAAPGSGFGAAAREHAYVPVVGTSFAAPIVSATAALLFEENVTDPSLIKQRLIATSTFEPDYAGRILGGLLNVRRAATNLGKAVMVDFADKEKVVRLLSFMDIYIFWPGGDDSIPARNILRVTRNQDDQTYRFIYRNRDDPSQLIIREHVNFDTNRPWKIKYSIRSSAGEHIVSDDLLSNYKDFFGPLPSSW